jgi:peptidoglycan/xylan/chitin deacetylase (PgdA/CDA1 family)
MTIKNITLTFDNGPTPGVTEHVLEVLKRHKILATFFVIGEKIAKSGGRSLAEYAARQGHWIGNHTYTHSIPLGNNPALDAPVMEIGRTQELLGDLAHSRRLFRPVGGGGVLGPHLLSERALAYLCDGKFTCVLWNAVPRDWENPENWVDVALDQCRRQAWTTLVLHDLPTGAMRHLDAFVERALSEGASFQQGMSPDCIVVEKGEITADVSNYTNPVKA